MAITTKSSRGWLEVFKFLSPQDLLNIETVCILWKSWSRSDEVWQHHLIVPPYDACSFRHACRHQLVSPQFIPYGASQEIGVYYPHTQTHEKVHIQEYFPNWEGATWESLLDSLFVCGGWRYYGSDLYSVSECFQLIFRKMKAEELPLMSTRRHYVGLTYFYGKVYAFGGFTASAGYDEGCLSICEAFTLAAKQWNPLPSMSVRRCAFVPARFKSSIYIAGGTALSHEIEVFSLISETFQRNIDTGVDLSSISAKAVVLNNVLMVIGNCRVWECDVNSGECIEKCEFNEWEEYSFAGVLACRGKAYFSNGFHLWTLSKDFELEKVC